jgi:hypothetical protein
MDWIGLFLALFRGLKACLECKRFDQGMEYGNVGVILDHKLFSPNLEKLKKLKEEEKEKELKKKEIILKRDEKKEMMKLLEKRNILIGQDEEVELKQSPVDEFNPNGEIIQTEEGNLLFQVLFIYDDYSRCDFIQQFSENDTFHDHLDEMFPPNGPEFPFGDENAKKKYILPNLRIYFWDQDSKNKFHQKFIRIDPKKKLMEILKRKDYKMPKNMKPIFHIVCSESELVKKWEK